MLLAIDVGNTAIMLGTIEEGSIENILRIHTEPRYTAAEYGIQLRQLMDYYNIAPGRLEGAIICSVVPTVTEALCEAIYHLTGLNVMVVGPGIRTGMNVRIDDPSTLAGDLVVGSVAAIAYYGTPAIVLNMGTATTMTVVDEKGTYRGGIIIPGVELGLQALKLAVDGVLMLQLLELVGDGSLLDGVAMQLGECLGRGLLLHDLLLELVELRESRFGGGGADARGNVGGGFGHLLL